MRSAASARVASALERHAHAVYPSAANFILFRIDAADCIFSGLKDRGVLVKNLNGSHPSLSNCLRVTIGTRDENDRFLEALQAARAAL